MANLTPADRSSPDLFGGVALDRSKTPASERRPPPELATARALCQQLRRKRARPDKQRIAHLICLNLVSMLKSGSAR